MHPCESWQQFVELQASFDTKLILHLIKNPAAAPVFLHNIRMTCIQIPINIYVPHQHCAHLQQPILKKNNAKDTLKIPKTCHNNGKFMENRVIITNLTNCRAKHEIKQKLRLFLISDKRKRKIQKTINVHYVCVCV